MRNLVSTFFFPPILTELLTKDVLFGVKSYEPENKKTCKFL